MSLENGSVIAHYKILSEIGKGGMGEVYLAEDTRLDRKVAVKFLNEEFSKDVDKLNRFIQEAKAVSALNHPNILTVHEIGETDDSNYIVTEFIEGKTLREYLSSNESISLSAILQIGVQVSEALSAAHQAGIVHRDIKPENIMIREDGYAKVLDFGLAKLTEKKKSERISLEGETKAFVQTNPGTVMGTVSYMSPEQARGKETDARTDIWSLGVVLYEMLSGKVPFTGETINHTIVSILEKEPKLLENVPDELQRIVRKALTKDKEMRYQTARDLLVDLKNLRRILDIQGELERPLIPDRSTKQPPVDENETQIHAPKSIGETKAETDTTQTQNVTSSSSLEYAIMQAKSHKLAAAVFGLILLGAISAIAYFGFFANRPGRQIESIAVMPFHSESGNGDIEYLSDGMTEILIGSLSQIPKLNVKARSSVFRYKGKEIDLQQIARELNVQAILNGRVIQRGEQVFLNLELVDAHTENVIWSEQYARKRSDLATLQSEIARDVSNKLRAKLSGAEQNQIAKNYTTNAEAYQLYLKGRYYWNKRTEADIKRSLDYFNQAIALDPGYALAYAGLADTYQVLPNLPGVSPEDAYPKARAAAQKALEIDPDLAEPHAALGVVLHEYDWNFGEAEKEFKRSIELNPNYASAHQWYGEYLMNMGRYDEAIAETRLAQQLDPLSLMINVVLGRAYYAAQRYDEAIAQYKKALELNPDFWGARLYLMKAHYAKGMYEEVLAERRKGRVPDGVSAEQVEKRMAALKEALRKSGARGFWEKSLEFEQEAADRRKTELPPLVLAEYQIRLGDREKALVLLEKAFETNQRSLGLLQIKADPVWAPLRSDPRFADLLRRMNLPPTNN
jgi:serine/threonine protein kinase/Tfp pilus assembly protein PilF